MTAMLDGPRGTLQAARVTAEDRALIELGRWLRARNYRFVTPTPATHVRVNARADNAEARTIEGALGWSRPFRGGALPEVERLLAAGGMLHRDGTWYRSAVRFSTIASESIAGARVDDAALIMHSAFPTSDPASVFFGPDTYRFIAALRRCVRPAQRLVDIGAGTGAGGLSLQDRAQHIVLADINAEALRHARINRALADAPAGAVETVESDVLAGIDGDFDAVIANPPYLADRQRRVYRDGGGALGIDLSLRIVREALPRLAPGGQLVLYTGSPVLEGSHPLREALRPILAARTCRATWSELDPDVFGEELEASPYDRVERIAVISLVVDAA
jgi:methylase of polypeptide subunit release factors